MSTTPEAGTRATRVRRSSTLRGMLPLTRLREVRINAFLTQAELASASGITRSTVIRLEQGEAVARPSTIRKLAAALRVQPAKLR